MGRGFAWLRRASWRVALAGLVGSAFAMLALPGSVSTAGRAPAADIIPTCNVGFGPAPGTIPITVTEGCTIP